MSLNVRVLTEVEKCLVLTQRALPTAELERDDDRVIGQGVAMALMRVRLLMNRYRTKTSKGAAAD